MKKYLIPALLILVASCNSSSNQNTISATKQATEPALPQFKITSPTFKQGEMIPALYTCDSTNISPALQWTKPSDKVKSYALITDDPDAPMGTWVHWVVYNIPATDSSLPEHRPTDTIFASGIHQGITSLHAYGYGGPCPPNGMHRYFFRLYALDTTFNLPCKTTGAKTLTSAMKGHILAETELMGKYEKKVKSEK